MSFFLGVSHPIRTRRRLRSRCASKMELASTVQLQGDREAEARAILRQLESLAVPGEITR